MADIKHNIVNFPYKCPKCRVRNFAQLNQLRAHIEKDHQVLGNFRQRSNILDFDIRKDISGRATLKKFMEENNQLEKQLEELKKKEKINRVLRRNSSSSSQVSRHQSIDDDSNPKSDKPSLQYGSPLIPTPDNRLSQAVSNPTLDKPSLRYGTPLIPTQDDRLSQAVNSLNDEVETGRIKLWNTSDALYQSKDIMEGLEVATETRNMEQDKFLSVIDKTLKLRSKALEKAYSDIDQLRGERKLLLDQIDSMMPGEKTPSLSEQADCSPASGPREISNKKLHSQSNSLSRDETMIPEKLSLSSNENRTVNEQIGNSASENTVLGNQNFNSLQSFPSNASLGSPLISSSIGLNTTDTIPISNSGSIMTPQLLPTHDSNNTVTPQTIFNNDSLNTDLGHLRLTPVSLNHDSGHPQLNPVPLSTKLGHTGNSSVYLSPINHVADTSHPNIFPAPSVYNTPNNSEGSVYQTQNNYVDNIHPSVQQAPVTSHPSVYHVDNSNSHPVVHQVPLNHADSSYPPVYHANNGHPSIGAHANTSQPPVYQSQNNHSSQPSVQTTAVNFVDNSHPSVYRTQNNHFNNSDPSVRHGPVNSHPSVYRASVNHVDGNHLTPYKELSNHANISQQPSVNQAPLNHIDSSHPYMYPVPNNHDNSHPSVNQASIHPVDSRHPYICPVPNNHVNNSHPAVYRHPNNYTNTNHLSTALTNQVLSAENNIHLEHNRDPSGFGLRQQYTKPLLRPSSQTEPHHLRNGQIFLDNNPSSPELQTVPQRLHSRTSDINEPAIDIYKLKIMTQEEELESMTSHLYKLKQKAAKEIKSRDSKLSMALKRSEKLENDREVLLLEMEDLLSKANVNNEKLQSDLLSNERELKQLTKKLDHTKSSQAQMMSETYDLYKDAEENIETLNAKLEHKEKELGQFKTYADSIKHERDRIADENTRVALEAQKSGVNLKSLLDVKNTEIDSIQRELKTIKEREQQLHDDKTKLEVKINESKMVQTKLDKEIQEKQDELNLSNSELDTIKSYLKNTAAKEKLARCELEEFISNLINRAEKAENQIHDLKIQLENETELRTALQEAEDEASRSLEELVSAKTNRENSLKRISDENKRSKMKAKNHYSSHVSPGRSEDVPSPRAKPRKNPPNTESFKRKDRSSKKSSDSIKRSSHKKIIPQKHTEESSDYSEESEYSDISTKTKSSKRGQSEYPKQNKTNRDKQEDVQKYAYFQNGDKIMLVSAQELFAAQNLGHAGQILKPDPLQKTPPNSGQMAAPNQTKLSSDNLSNEAREGQSNFVQLPHSTSNSQAPVTSSPSHSNNPSSTPNQSHNPSQSWNPSQFHNQTPLSPSHNNDTLHNSNTLHNPSQSQNPNQIHNPSLQNRLLQTSSPSYTDLQHHPSPLNAPSSSLNSPLSHNPNLSYNPSTLHNPLLSHHHSPAHNPSPSHLLNQLDHSNLSHNPGSSYNHSQLHNTNVSSPSSYNSSPYQERPSSLSPTYRMTYNKPAESYHDHLPQHPVTTSQGIYRPQHNSGRHFPSEQQPFNARNPTPNTDVNKDSLEYLTRSGVLTTEEQTAILSSRLHKAIVQQQLLSDDAEDEDDGEEYSDDVELRKKERKIKNYYKEKEKLLLSEDSVTDLEELGILDDVPGVKYENILKDRYHVKPLTLSVDKDEQFSVDDDGILWDDGGTTTYASEDLDSFRISPSGSETAGDLDSHQILSGSSGDSKDYLNNSKHGRLDTIGENRESPSPSKSSDSFKNFQEVRNKIQKRKTDKEELDAAIGILQGQHSSESDSKDNKLNNQHPQKLSPLSDNGHDSEQLDLKENSGTSSPVYKSKYLNSLANNNAKSRFMAESTGPLSHSPFQTYSERSRSVSPNLSNNLNNSELVSNRSRAVSPNLSNDINNSAYHNENHRAIPTRSPSPNLSPSPISRNPSESRFEQFYKNRELLSPLSARINTILNDNNSRASTPAIVVNSLDSDKSFMAENSPIPYSPASSRKSSFETSPVENGPTSGTFDGKSSTGNISDVNSLDKSNPREIRAAQQTSESSPVQSQTNQSLQYTNQQISTPMENDNSKSNANETKQNSDVSLESADIAKYQLLPLKQAKSYLSDVNESQVSSDEDANVQVPRKEESTDTGMDFESDLEKLATPHKLGRAGVVGVKGSSKKTGPLLHKKLKTRRQYADRGKDDSSSAFSDSGHKTGHRKQEETKRRRVALFRVFNYLDSKSLCLVSLVCREWKHVSRHPALWKSVQFKNQAISSSFLVTLSKWCTQTEYLTLEGLQTRRRFDEESLEEYQRNTRACVEPGLEEVLKMCQNTLKSLRIINCGNLLTDKCIWLVSGYCRLLQKFYYISDTDPVAAETLWALGGGCPGITTLVIPPLYPCKHPKAFTNKCLILIGKFYPDMLEIGVGGREIDQAGLLPLVSGCQRLTYFQLDHIKIMTEDLSTALCRAGLRQLNTLELINMAVEPKAILQFYKSCHKLKRIEINIHFTDYYDDLKIKKHRNDYKKKIGLLQDLRSKAGIGHILKIYAEQVE